MIDMRAEISEGNWCSFVWHEETESIRVEWESGHPPDNPTPKMRERMNEVMSEFMVAVRAESLKAIMEKLEEQQ